MNCESHSCTLIFENNHTQNEPIRRKCYYWVYLTSALKEKYVGTEEMGNRIWEVFYRNVF